MNRSPISLQRSFAILILSGHTGAVRTIAYSPDGHKLLSGAEDGTVRIWDLIRGCEAAAVHQRGIVNSVAWFPSGEAVAATSEEGLFRYTTNLRPKPWVVSEQIHPHGARESRDLANPPVIAIRGEWAAVGVLSRNNRWVFKFRHSGRAPLDRGTQARQENATFIPDGSRAIFADRYGANRCFAIALDENGVLTTGGWGMSSLTAWATLMGTNYMNHQRGKVQGPIYAVEQAPTDLRIALGRENGRILIVDRATMKPVRVKFAGHLGAIWTLAWSPDGLTLLSGSCDGMVWWWDAGTGKVIQKWNWKLGPIFSVAFSPLGMTAAASGENGEIVIWDLERP